MAEQNSSAFAALRALRDELRGRLEQNEDYRAWKALDDILRELEPPTLPRAVDLALSAMSATPRVTAVEPSRGDDSPLKFRDSA